MTKKMAKRIRWDEEEAVIMLDALVKSSDGIITRKEAVSYVSNALRQRAVNKGMVIDDIFRNENGISLQMSTMEYIFTNGAHGLKKESMPKLFENVVDMYRNEYEEYEKILKEARQSVSGETSTENLFVAWLADKVSPAKLSDLFIMLVEIEEYFLQKGILKRKLFETTELDVIDSVISMMGSNALFRFKYRKKLIRMHSAIDYYYEFVKSSIKTNYTNSLNEADIVPSNYTAYESTVNQGRISVKKILSPVLESQNNVCAADFQNEVHSFNQTSELENNDNFDVMKLNVSNDFIVTHETSTENLETAEQIDEMNCEESQQIKKAEINDAHIQIEKNENIPEDNGNLHSKTSVSSISSMSSLKKGVIAAYCVSKYNKKALRALGYHLYGDFYGDAGKKIGLHSYDIKKFKGDLDPYLNSSCKKPLKKLSTTEKEVIDTFERYDDHKTIQLVKQILSDSQENISDVVISASTQELNEKNSISLTKSVQKAQQNYTIDSETCQIYIAESKGAYKNEPYEEILKKDFKKGFRLGSTLEIRKFRKYYNTLNVNETSDSDDEIIRIIKKLCIIYNDKAFLPEAMLSSEIKEKLLAYIKEVFDSGKSVIYYQALYKEFSDAFLDYHIHDEHMLKAYLEAVGDRQLYYEKKYISSSPYAAPKPIEEIRECLIKYGRPMEYKELFSELSHIPEDKIKNVLRGNAEFVKNANGVYFHESIFYISEYDLENISLMIEKAIEEKYFIGGNELYNAVKAKYPYIIDDNQTVTVYGFRDLLKVKFVGRFSFKGNIISSYGKEISMSDVFANFARRNDSFTLSDLQTLALELSTIIYFDAVYNNSLRISKNQFVSSEQAQFPVAEIDQAIDYICGGRYIPIKEITNFSIFPYAGFTWNGFLFEHYVANYSEKYILLHKDFSANNCAGAVVKKAAGISDFNDLIIDILSNSTIELNKEKVLHFLCDKGYIASQKHAEIESLIIKAKAIRNRKEM